MRMPCYPWGVRALWDGRPTVGWLMDLCEENYLYLLRLAPELRSLEGRFLSRRREVAMDLHLEILEQTPYTTLLHLTYYFSQGAGGQPDPDARLRVYHDSGQAEVVETGAEELDELADHTGAAQDLGDGQHQVGGGRPLGQAAGQPEADHVAVALAGGLVAHDQRVARLRDEQERYTSSVLEISARLLQDDPFGY